MDKSSLFRILNFTDSADVVSLGGILGDKREVTVLKKPQKTLVMLKVRESAQNTLFYAGEALACECAVKIGETKGFAAALGDDMEKVYAMAVIDACLNAGLSESDMILEKLREWGLKLAEKRAAESKLTMSTKVNFSVMEE